LASVCPIYDKFLAKKIENGNVCGNIDFSIVNVFFSIHILSIRFNFLSLTAKNDLF